MPPLLGAAPYDVVFVIADGLSPVAVQRHGAALAASLPRPPAGLVASRPWSSRPRRAWRSATRSATALGAQLCVMLIGERPGLSVADSLGVYLTYAPRPGRRDSERNCISNIHADGLS